MTAVFSEFTNATLALTLSKSRCSPNKHCESIYFRPITTNVVQLCPIESNKSTTSVTLVKIFSSGRSSGADLWQKCTRNG